MWSFFGRENNQDDDDPKVLQAEKEALREEAAELRSKMEALRMADYRDMQRSQLVHGIPVDGDEGSVAGRANGQEQQWQAVKWQAVIKEIKERESKLEEQIASQDRKLAKAATTLTRTREQLKHLNSDIGLKESEEAKMNAQAEQFQVLLTEKEKRLQAALEEATNVLAEKGEADETDLQPSGVAALEVQLVDLANITEELTDALERAREGQEDARRQLLAVGARLREEHLRSTESDRALRAAKKTRDHEVATLLSQVWQLDAALADERRKVQELEAHSARVEIEDQLDQALHARGKSLKYYHFDI